jgi:hypothetical protein
VQEIVFLVENVLLRVYLPESFNPLASGLGVFGLFLDEFTLASMRDGVFWGVAEVALQALLLLEERCGLGVASGGVREAILNLLVDYCDRL